jgi:hypothetical protein
VRAEAEAVLREAVREYGDGDAETRENIRMVFAANESFSWAATLPFPPSTPERLRDHLLLFSIIDQGRYASSARVIPGACVQFGNPLGNGLQVPQLTASLMAFTGRARTVLLAGLAANVCSCFVKGLMPLRAGQAGFFTTTNFAKPGSMNRPFFLSSL